MAFGGLPEGRSVRGARAWNTSTAIFELRLVDLVGGELAPLDCELVRVDLTERERRAYGEGMEPFQRATRLFFRARPDGTWPELVRAVSSSPQGRELMARYRLARRIVDTCKGKMDVVAQQLRSEPQRRTLIFTAGNDAAYALSRRLLIPAMTCDIDRKERKTILERFGDGSLRALISARVLNEGWDVPEAEAAIVVGGSLGGGEHVQRIGRVLRPKAGKRARVIEVIAAGTHEEKQSRRREAYLVHGTAALF